MTPVIAEYTKCCTRIEEQLDELGNELDIRRDDEIDFVLRHGRKSFDLLFDDLDRVALRLAELIRPDAAFQLTDAGSRLTRETRRARKQLDDLWSLPFDKVQLTITPLDLRRELLRIIDELESIFDAHNASGKNVNIAIDGMLHTDRVLFSMAVSNVIANAIIHSRRGPELRLNIVGAIDGRANVDSCHRKILYMSISDNGPGIDTNECGVIFQLFRQGVQGRLSEIGSGVGLALATLAMDLLDGSLTLGPNTSDGAVFVLAFPLQG